MLSKYFFTILLFTLAVGNAQSIIVKATSCLDGDFTYARFTYTVKDSNVIEKLELLEKNKVTVVDITKLKNCIVVDNFNWQCGDLNTDFSHKKAVTNGKFFYTPSKAESKPGKYCDFYFKMEQVN